MSTDKTYQITTECDSRTKSRRFHTCTVTAATADDAALEARMRHMAKLGWVTQDISIWEKSVEEVSGR